MTWWEYKRVDVDADEGSESVKKILDGHGEAHWELIAVTAIGVNQPRTSFYFKRQRQDKTGTGSTRP